MIEIEIRLVFYFIIFLLLFFWCCLFLLFLRLRIFERKLLFSLSKHTNRSQFRKRNQMMKIIIKKIINKKLGKLDVM